MQLRFGIFVSFVVVLLAACGSEEDVDVDVGITDSSDALVQHNGVTYWPKVNGYVRINVCFVPSEVLTHMTQAQRAMVHEGIEQTWSRYAPIYTYNWGECRLPLGSGGEDLHVNIGWGPDGATPIMGRCSRGADGAAIYFNGTPGPCNMGIGFGSPTAPDIEQVIGHMVHEFGHVLGFFHEEARADLPAYVVTGNGSNCHSQFGDPNFYGVGSFDVNSVMSYCSYSHGGPGTTGVNGNATGQPTPDNGSGFGGPYGGRYRGSWPELSSGDIYAVQLKYGRKARGTLSGAGTTAGPAFGSGAGMGCMSAAGTAVGTFVRTAPCGSAGMGQTFMYDSYTQHLLDFQPGTRYAALESYNGFADLWTENTTTAESWRFQNVQIRGLGGMAIGGRDTAGEQQLMVGTQAFSKNNSGANAVTNTRPMRFNIGGGTDTSIRLITEDGSPTSLCLEVRSGTGATAPVQLAKCNSSAAQQWWLNDGAIVSFGSGKCLEVVATAVKAPATGVRVYDGELLRVAACVEALPQKFHLTGTVANGGTGSFSTCLTNTDAAPTTGGLLRSAAACTGAASQQWDYYF